MSEEYFKVGHTLAPERFVADRDFIKFEYMDCAVIVAWWNPTLKEVMLFEFGDVVLKLVAFPKVAFLVIQIDSLKWCDALFSIYLYSKQVRKKIREKIQKEIPRELHFVLVDRDSHVVEVNRFLKVSFEFANILNNAVINQFRNPHTKDEFFKELESVRQKYTPKDLASSEYVVTSCYITANPKQ